MTYSKYQACSWHLFFVVGKSQVRNSPEDYTVLEVLYDILYISTKILELPLNKARLSLASVQLLIYITQSFLSLTHTWCGYKKTGLNFFPLPCKLGNSGRCVVLACALPSIHGYNFKVVWQTVWQ